MRAQQGDDVGAGQRAEHGDRLGGPPEAGEPGDGGALQQGEGEPDQAVGAGHTLEPGEELGEQVADAGLEPGRDGGDDDGQLGVGPGGHDQLERGRVGGALEDRPQQVDGPGQGPLPRREGGEGVGEGLLLPGEDMLDGGHHQVALRRVVVDLGAAGDAGPADDLGGAGAGVAELDQRRHGGVEERDLGLGAPLGLGPSGRGHRPTMDALEQTVKTVCNGAARRRD